MINGYRVEVLISGDWVPAVRGEMLAGSGLSAEEASTYEEPHEAEEALMVLEAEHPGSYRCRAVAADEEK